MASSDPRPKVFGLGVVFGIVLGILGTIAVCMLTSCAPGPDLAAYSAEQAACVQRAKTREESQACRGASKRLWHSRWCLAGYETYCAEE